MVKYVSTIIYTLNKRKESIIAFIRTLSKTKEAIHQGWCISIEWPIGRVSLIQVISWGMKLSAFYTRCERACNPWPSAQASGQECVTSLCEFQQVETPVCLFPSLLNLQVWTCLFKETLHLAFEEVFLLPPFCTRKNVTFFLFSGQLLCISVFELFLP